MADSGQCIQRELDKAETEMQQTYDRVIAAFVPTLEHREEGKQVGASVNYYEVVRKSLQSSQDTWLQFRTEFCAAVEATYDSGTGASLAVPNYKRELTVQRTSN